MSSAKLIVVAAFSLEKKLDDVAEDGVRWDVGGSKARGISPPGRV
jgi:hypothetical protein